MAEYKNPTWPYFALGIIAGAVVGVLFAKKPGEETREDVKDWLKEKREEGKEMLAKWKEKATPEHAAHRSKEFAEN